MTYFFWLGVCRDYHTGVKKNLNQYTKNLGDERGSNEQGSLISLHIHEEKKRKKECGSVSAKQERSAEHFLLMIKGEPKHVNAVDPDM